MTIEINKMFSSIVYSDTQKTLDKLCNDMTYEEKQKIKKHPFDDLWEASNEYEFDPCPSHIEKWKASNAYEKEQMGRPPQGDIYFNVSTQKEDR